MRATIKEDAIVIVWKRGVLTVLAGLGITLNGYSQTGPTPEPARLGVNPGAVPAARETPNQQMANAIAAHLRQSGILRQYQVNIAYQDGFVDLTGQVADRSQRDEVVRLVYGVPGVAQVRDRMVITSAPATQLTQAQEPPKLEVPPPPALKPPDQGLPEPTPIFQGVPPGQLPNPNLLPPRMPPYAWPTYAPYNNYSRVAYPTQYPYEAWPFIGPMYPFPKIPPGWRSIQLKWMDGYWWYGKQASGHDWWRIRYR